MGTQRYTQPLGGEENPSAFERTATISRRLQGGRSSGGSRDGVDPAAAGFDRSKTMGSSSRKPKSTAEGDGGGGGGPVPTSTRRRPSGEGGGTSSSSRSSSKAQFNRVNSMVQHPTTGQDTGQGDDGPKFNRTLSMTSKTPKAQKIIQQQKAEEEAEAEVDEVGQKFGRSMTLGSKPRFKGGAEKTSGSGGSSSRSGSGQGSSSRSSAAQDSLGGSRSRSPLPATQQLKPALKKSSTSTPSSRSRNPSDSGQMMGPGGVDRSASPFGGPRVASPEVGGMMQGYGDGMGGAYGGDPNYAYMQQQQQQQHMAQQGRQRDPRGMVMHQQGMQGQMDDGYGYGGPMPGNDGSMTPYMMQQQQQQMQQQQQPPPQQDAGGGDGDVVLPMLPPPGAPQVVQCQKCAQLLEVPTVLPPAKKGVQKLRCGKCLRVSRFKLNPADPRNAQAAAPPSHGGGGYGDTSDIDSSVEGSSISGSTPRMNSVPGGGGSYPNHMQGGGGGGNMYGQHQMGGMDGMQMRPSSGQSWQGSMDGGGAPYMSDDGGYGGGGGGQRPNSGQPQRPHPHAGHRMPGGPMAQQQQQQHHWPQGSMDGHDMMMGPAGGQMSPMPGGGGGMAMSPNAGGMMEDRPTFGRRVVVNGEPVRDDFVQIAEARAGPIHPGNYWYDAIAGFWGEMGGPCLGIIPPGIDFGVPMPRNCAGGSTRVVVNGRELHLKDLERLMKRGLPPQPNLAYRIEINGNVFDWDTGEYLLSLGKLAPSLETRKRGGGMKMSSE